MEIIDAHAHIYPQKIAEKATEAIGNFYNLKMEIEAGTSERLIIEGKKAGVSKYIVHSCATKPSQVRSINEFIKGEIDKHKEFIGFMTLHQGLTEEEIAEEIKWCKENGFKGIKLHPDFQQFDIDGTDAEKFYNVLNFLGIEFPILLHMGDKRYGYSKPFRLRNVAKKYPKLNFIGAHFGGYNCWDEVDVYTGLNNVYFDTSSSLDFIGSEKALFLIKKFGVEKFFFGADFPMWKVEDEVRRFMKIKLTDDEREKILSKNVKNLLSIR